MSRPLTAAEELVYAAAFALDLCRKESTPDSAMQAAFNAVQALRHARAGRDAQNAVKRMLVDFREGGE